MSVGRLALVTATTFSDHDTDLAPLFDAIERRAPGRCRVEAWDDPGVDWASFDVAVLRSTWDYPTRLEEFSAWLVRVGGATELWNPPAVVRWNTDKRYLGELADAGVPIVPTDFVAPGEPTPAVDGMRIVKPTIGAGSLGARRCGPDEVADHVAALHADGRTAMIQPYVDAIDEVGETGMSFVASVAELSFSHAFGKTAILGDTDVDVGVGSIAVEHIWPREATPSELDLAAQVLSCRPVAALGALAYARVDVVTTPDGPVLMELELTEPSLYLQHGDGSADRAAEAFLGLLDG